jgi:hypothetical protein
MDIIPFAVRHRLNIYDADVLESALPKIREEVLFYVAALVARILPVLVDLLIQIALSELSDGELPRRFGRRIGPQLPLFLNR